MSFKKNSIIIIILLNIISCNKVFDNGELIKEDKFTLSIGNMDSELDFFSREGISFSLKSDIYYFNGLFYISNGNGKKIMKFTSYGDLLQKIAPSRHTDLAAYDESSWIFNEPGAITATTKYIYIEDTIEYESTNIDEYIDKSRDTSNDGSDDLKHILNEKIISIFNENGKYINYIGQEGLGGTPFPFINNIYTNSKNELIIVTQTTFFWTIFKFKEDGEFIDKYVIELDFLPQLENEDNILTQIDNIIPDREKNRVLVELTFFKKIYDDKTSAIISMESIKSRVYYYDLESRNYFSMMDIPNEKSEEISQHHVLLDIVKGKYLFFISQGVNGLSQFLTITNENGYIIGQYDLNIDNSNIIFSSFYISSPEGILTGLLCTEYAGGVSMWRTDKILEEDMK